MTPPVPATSPGRPDRLYRSVFTAFAVLGALLVGYVLWLILRHDFRYSVLWNGWVPDGFEFVVSALCIARGLTRRTGGAAAIFLGAGLMLWGFGDTVWTVQSVVGTSSLTNYLGAAFWLGFYPLAYVAVVLFVRGKVRPLTTPTWLDGAVAALGTSAVCAAFAFHGVDAYVTTSTLTKATNLAYPIGDLVLLALVVGGSALLSGWSSAPWLVLATACLLNCIGDTFNLFGSLDGQIRLDTIFHALAWPAAGLLMAIAVWLRARPVDLLARERSASYLLPGLAAAAGLGVLIAGTDVRVSPIALDLAIAALVAAGIRLVLSTRGLQSLTEDRHRQSMTDELTGLGNRRYLFDICNAFFRDQADPKADRRRLVFLFVDLDHFKEVNDSFGHLAGDELLKQLGPRLTRSLGPSDVLVRFGGDEFAVVLIDADVDYATAVAGQLTSSLEQPFDLSGVNATVSASIGIAAVPTDATDIGGLMECADVAMYRSKLGRIPYAFYDRRLDSANQWRLGDELRSAIERHQFLMHYQPQLDLRTGTITAVETLIRWQHPTLGVLTPARFIPLAEEAGLMPSLTALVMDDALAQGSAWIRAGHHLAVSVNISASNLLDDGFTECVRAALERHQFPASLLTLEITETTVIANFERSKLVIQQLADLGIVFSIDDFGAGFTSLSYLSSLALGELKLDSQLITDLAADGRNRDRELVRSTIELGHALELRVVAEGVEDKATLDLLFELGCDFAQGYFINRPIPADKLDLGHRITLGAAGEVPARRLLGARA